MTEKEKYYTAKLYIDKLANGINPIDNVEISEDSILNDICICRTFNFISTVLDEVIRNDCVISIPNRKKSKFRITEDQKSAIAISENPVKITVISHRIQKVLDPHVKTISGIRMAQWLEHEGLLKSVRQDDGRVHREATTDGNALGIETRVIHKGDDMYIANFYDVCAQAFIIANLESIAAFQENRNNYPVGANS